jgi:hypothetical protein
MLEGFIDMHPSDHSFRSRARQFSVHSQQAFTRVPSRQPVTQRHDTMREGKDSLALLDDQFGVDSPMAADTDSLAPAPRPVAGELASAPDRGRPATAYAGFSARYQ